MHLHSGFLTVSAALVALLLTNGNVLAQGPFEPLSKPMAVQMTRSPLGAPAGRRLQNVPAEPFRFTETTSGRGTVKYYGEIPVFTLQGTPDEIGEQTATLGREAIPPLLETPELVAKQFGVNLNLIKPLATSAAKMMISHSPDRYRQEMDALALHLKSDASLLYVATSLTELRRIGGCSAFIVSPERSATGEMIFGRNFDFPTFGVLDRFSCVAIVRPEGKFAFASVAVPGFTGVVSGMNEHGLTLSTLDVYASADGSPVFNVNGAPLALTYRQILEECTTVEEARQLLEKTPRTTWMNLACCDKTRSVIFELTPAKVGVRESENQLTRCTNHFMLPDLHANVSCERYRTLGRLMDFKEGEKFSLEEVHRAMHAVHQGSLTFQTMIFEPSTLKLHVAFGPGPCTKKPLQTLELKELFAQAAPVAQ